VQEENDTLALENLTLKQKVADLTLLIARLRFENIKVSADLSRSKIRYDNISGRIEVCMRELGDRDEEISRLKRELAALRRDAAPVGASLLKLKGAAAERARLEREQQRAIQAASVAEGARARATGEATKSFLDRVIINQRAAAARLDAQRRKWTELERNHLMSVLGAMSLLSTSQYRIVREVLPDYSPFSTSKVSVLRDLISRAKAQRNGEIEDIPRRPPPPRKPLLYGEKVTKMDKVVPELTQDERKLVVQMREPKEIEKKIEDVIEEEQRQSRLSQAKIEIMQVGEANVDGIGEKPGAIDRII
jgi:hypothetical protein